MFYIENKHGVAHCIATLVVFSRSIKFADLCISQATFCSFLTLGNYVQRDHWWDKQSLVAMSTEGFMGVEYCCVASHLAWLNRWVKKSTPDALICANVDNAIAAKVDTLNSPRASAVLPCLRAD